MARTFRYRCISTDTEFYVVEGTPTAEYVSTARVAKDMEKLYEVDPVTFEKLRKGGKAAKETTPKETPAETEATAEVTEPKTDDATAEAGE